MSKYVKEGERNSKYFFALEKANYNKKAMTSIKVDNKIVNSPKQILEEQARFYEDLYTSNHKIKFDLKNVTTKQISDEDKQSMERNFTMEEFTRAVRGLKANKVGGYDGFSAEFFQFFWIKIQNLHLATLQHSYVTGSFYRTARKGIITLIPKKRKRPIISKKLKTSYYAFHRL